MVWKGVFGLKETHFHASPTVATSAWKLSVDALRDRAPFLVSILGEATTKDKVSRERPMRR